MNNEKILTTDCLDDYIDLFKAGGSNKKKENLEWLHFNNVVNDTQCQLVYDKSGSLASIYATLPVYVNLAGERVSAVQSLDTITSVNNRGQGLFIASAEKVYDSCKKEGYGFVYGFPNGSSIHGFSKKLSWKVLDPIPFLFKPMRLGYFIKKVIKKWPQNFIDLPIYFGGKIQKKDMERISPVTSFDDEFTDLWRCFSELFSVAVERDAEYLKWRYLQKPNEDYKIFQYRNVEGLLGYIVYSVKYKHGGSIGYIMDLIYCPDNPHVGELLLKFALKEMKKSKADAVLSWCFDFSPNYPAFKKNGFHNLPEKIRPIELHFGCLSFSTSYDFIYNRENWFISYADSDTV
jgi:hypothetical protein